jgi:RNA polymerase sigma-70 factor (ECF subfamily)
VEQAESNQGSTDPYSTRSSIFLRIRSADPRLRELAWHEFHGRYAPIIAGFARAMGVRSENVPDIVQDVLLGFYSVSPRFVYDPSKGRFRSYLMTVAANAIRRTAAAHGGALVGSDSLKANSAELERAWREEWSRDLLNRALAELRRKYKSSKTFRAYELYVIEGLPPEEVAKQVGISVDSVYQAKTRINNVLGMRVRQLDEEEG